MHNVNILKIAFKNRHIRPMAVLECGGHFCFEIYGLSGNGALSGCIGGQT